MIFINVSLFANKLSENALQLCIFEIFIEILKLCNIINVIAPWKESIMVFALDNNIPNISGKAKLSRNRFVLIEMVHDLVVQHVNAVNVFLFAHEFKVVNQ